MTTILAIDPGSAASGWVLMDSDTGRVIGHGKVPNDVLLGHLTAGTIAPLPANGTAPEDPDLVLIEAMGGRHGMPFGVTVIEALRWSGRFEQAVDPLPVVRISRDEIKRQLLGKAANQRGADGLLRVLLIDRWAARAGDPLGGKAAAVGTVRAPGPLHGVKADAWQALALWEAWSDGADDVDTERIEAAERKAERDAKKRVPA